MATASDQPAEPQAGVMPVTPAPRGRPLAAWVVILLAVATAFVGQLVLQRTVEGKKETANALLEMQAREVIAAARLDPSRRTKFYEDMEPLVKKGPEAERLRFVVVAGELAGPDEALRQLRQLDPEPDDARTAEILEKLYKDYRQGQPAAQSLSAEERQELQAKLGWFGELALAPEGTPDVAARAAVLQPAQRTLYIVIGVVVGILALGVVGCCLQIVMAILLYLRQVRLRFTTGSPNGSIYAETFALWMVLFMGLSLAGGALPTGQNRILVTGLLAMSSLVALAWPVFRGVPWRTVRQEIGLVWTDRAPVRTEIAERDDAYAPAALLLSWKRAKEEEGKKRQGHRSPLHHFPSSPLLEVVFGLASYVGTLPLLFLGALLTFGLMHLYKSMFGEGGDPLGIGPDPSHPIAGFLLNANWWGRLQVIVAASVGAPIVEETMFRGVLYRHLREATGHWGRALSVLASAAVVSFIFAVVHPQGILAVPALMALAIGFSLAREWRGTLVPSMLGHGLNNLMVTVLLLVVAS
jgi:membrane protease YdiL (CAAX protease family)